MDYPNNSTESRKNKNLNFEECMTIQLRLKDWHSPNRIAKELKRTRNTVLNEMHRSTTTQIKQGKYIDTYLADTGEAIYKKYCLNSCRTFKRLECYDFINYAVSKIKNDSWSPDACVGKNLETGKFEQSQIVFTKILYNYIDLGLILVKNIDLPMKLRRNTKPAIIRKHKKKLGKSIAKRPSDINSREEFGYWEIDTVIGEKSCDDCVLLTILEHMTRNVIVRKIESNSANAVMNEISSIRKLYGHEFSQVFKTITGDNGSEFTELSTLEIDIIYVA
ncbi:IS30 family transposase [Clostridium sp.]|uniref:IS30 family transposase n=1 Tax=Clostridium sp. TaxID=1506 RepID=UPI0032164E0D